MRKALGVLFALLAIAQLGFRGMQRVRSDVPLWDFVSVHSAARTWIHGGNPYDQPAIIATWRESGIFVDRDVNYFATVYPPNSLVMILPLALLPAGPAMVLWLGIMLLLLAIQFILLTRMAEIPAMDWRAWLVATAALASAPLQFGILSGQLSLPAISICIIAFWLSGHRWERLAGVLLGLACAIKPQVGGPFVVYYMLRRQFRVAGWAMLVGGAIGIGSIAAMQLSHVDWITGWTQSMAGTTKVGAVNDYGWTNPFRDEILDLRMLVSMIDDPHKQRAIVGAVELVLAAWFGMAIWRKGWPVGRDQLLALAAFSGLLLLPIYHRVYDATLLSLALAWALAELDGARRRQAIALLVVMAVFLIPFDLVKSVGMRAPRFMKLARGDFWQSWIAPHYAWGLLAATVVLIFVLSRSARQSSGIAPA